MIQPFFSITGASFLCCLFSSSLWFYSSSLSTLHESLFGLLVSAPEQVQTKQSAAASSEKSEQQAKLAENEFNSLLYANHETAGRDNLIAKCRQFLIGHPQDPRRVKILLRIANLYGFGNESVGYEAKPEQALKWYRVAAKHAEKGSDIWCEAKFGISEKLRYLAGQDEQIEDSDGQKKLLAESREALEAVASEGLTPFHQLRAEAELVNQYRLEDNPLGMEMQAKRVLDWESPQNAEELDPRDAQMIRVMKMGAAHNLTELAVHADSLDAFAPASMAGSKKQRVKYLAELVAKYPTPEVAQSVERALKQMKSRPEPTLSRVPSASPAKAERQRYFWIVVNILAVVLFGLTIVIRQRAMRQQT